MLKFNSLKEIFDYFCEDIKVDKKFIKEVEAWKNQFISKNPEHVAFFTGSYFGTHIPKWTDKDDDHFLIEIAQIDEDEIADYVYTLPTINKDFVVSSNIFSITLVYFMHLAQISKHLNDKERDSLKTILMEILNIKYLTSIMNHYFSRGKTTEQIAQEVFNRMSKRYDLKQEGSWLKLIEHRSKQQVLGDYERNAKHDKQDVFNTFEDELVVRKLNAVKTRMNQTIVDINQIFRQVLEDQEKIERTRQIAGKDETAYILDLVRDNSVYLRYQDSIFPDKASFMKQELLDVVVQSFPAISENIFVSALEWMLDNQNDKKYSKVILAIRHDILVYSLGVLHSENIKTTDLLSVSQRLRMNLVSGKTSDPVVQRVRKDIDKLIITFRPKSKGKIISLERTAIMLYIVLRTLSMHYYR